MVGQVKVNPDGAKLRMDYQQTVLYLPIDEEEWEVLGKNQSVSPELGDERMTINYLNTDEELVVIGDLMNGQISGGDEFIISNQGNEGLLSGLKSEETAWYWIMKFVIWLLLFIGLSSIVGPLIAVLDFIPLVGSAARWVGGVIAAILALIIVVLATLLIRFWWLWLVLIILFVGLVVGALLYYRGRNMKAEEKK
jgi:hypothetical protein